MSTISVFVQGERLHEIDHIEAEAGDTLAAVKASLIEKYGLEADTLLFEEDGEEPLDLMSTIGSLAGRAGVKLHLHRCPHVHVGVTFNGETVHRDFRPGATVARVKRWAAEKIGMTPDEAGEHVLQLSGTQMRPAPGTHIGRLASCPECRVAFDLVPDERVNGA